MNTQNLYNATSCTIPSYTEVKKGNKILPPCDNCKYLMEGFTQANFTWRVVNFSRRNHIFIIYKTGAKVLSTNSTWAEIFCAWRVRSPPQSRCYGKWDWWWEIGATFKPEGHRDPKKKDPGVDFFLIIRMILPVTAVGAQSWLLHESR